MHFEILVEDESGKRALEILVPNIIGENHTCTVHPYKGIGHIPRNLSNSRDPRNKMLLNNLPKLIRGYGKTFNTYPTDYPAVLIVVCDLDDKCLKKYREELLAILESCDPRPITGFCIAIDEGEAWFLGDIDAIKSAYPNAKTSILDGYHNDSICGTWEKLADAIYAGGSASLSKKGWQAVSKEKSNWAEKISPNMDITNNSSPSFNYFRDKLRGVLD